MTQVYRLKNVDQIKKNHIFLFLNTILCEIFDCTTVTEIGMHLRVIIKRVNASISRWAKTDVV